MLIDAQISPSQFEQISRTVYGFCGIRLTKDKQNLVKSRLSKRLNALRLPGFDEYLAKVSTDREEFSQMIDILTTNKTDFFREMAHFEMLAKEVLPVIAKGSQKMRIWSAACSSGEEPYSISMLLHEAIPSIARWDVKILATDISSQILQKAKAAEYEEENLDGLSMSLQQKYLIKNGNGKYLVNDKVRNLVRFARLNLMQEWKMQGPFDVIFCRNVMIYFDKPTQGALVNRFYDLLPQGGYLFIGHSESLNGVQHNYRYIKPAVYQK